MKSMSEMDQYLEELENELRLLRESNYHLTNELTGVYRSNTYRVGTLMRLAYKDPARVARRGAKLVRQSIKMGPGVISRFRNTPPLDSNMLISAYKQWQNDFEPSAKELDDQRKAWSKFKKQPTISIITPVFKPPKDVLVELIESVLNQTYPCFELCMGEFSGDETTRKVLTEYSEKDSRIKVKFFDSNNGISENSDLCLTLATGEYIALLDHDDLFTPNALFENVKLINQDDYDFIYSDKDKIDESGNRFDPMFKPDWSPELMLTANYLTHLNVFKKKIIDEIGGWDKTTDGAQDWDLFFRIIERSKKVGHIPKILYHWRVIATSTAMSISTKPYALEGQKKAIRKYVESLGVEPPEVLHTKSGALSIEWGADYLSTKKVGFVIISSPETLSKASSLQKKLHKAYKSTNIEICDGKGATLGKITNEIAQTVDIVLFLSDDIESLGRKNWLSELVGWLSVPGVGIVSPHVFSREGIFLDAGRVAGLNSLATPLFSGDAYVPGIFGYREWSRNVLMPSVALFAVKSEVLKGWSIDQEGIQGLREIALRSIVSGYRTMVTPFDNVSVSRSAIFEPPLSEENLDLLQNAAPGYFDPYFSTNLSTQRNYPYFNNLEESLQRKDLLIALEEKQIEFDSSTSSATSIYATKHRLPLAGYRREAYILSGITDVSSGVILENKKIVENHRPIDEIDSAIWYLPHFTTFYAGLKNIFAMASKLTEYEKTNHVFYVMTHEEVSDIREMVVAVYPNLANSTFINAPGYESSYKSKSYKLGICTLWTTAYALVKNNHVKRKLYVIQDDERSFYPRGSLYGLCDQSYNFGFWGLAGTQALTHWYSADKNQPLTAVIASELELRKYLDNSGDRFRKKTKDSVPRVLFYARPDAPRNGFELGLWGLTKLAESMDGKVEIILAGADFDLSQYEGVHPSIKLAGKVPYSELADFYSSFDAALFLMFSEHPGVFPLEMMASGCPVVVNVHSNASWDELYKDGKNCLLALPSATDIADKLASLLTDDSLKKSIIASGRKTAEKFLETSHEAQVKDAITMIKTGKRVGDG